MKKTIFNDSQKEDHDKKFHADRMTQNGELSRGGCMLQPTSQIQSGGRTKLIERD